jgi:glycosyltransferase involved in cell wall biosynthesis
MIVAFDASTAAFRQKTGKGVYCEELIRAYQERFKEDKIIHTYRLSRRIKGAEHLLPIPANANRETLLDPWTYFKGNKYDIFHGLNSRLPMLASSKMVATIHDLFSIYGEFSDPAFKEEQTKKLRLMISRADHIIVPAQFTRDQLVEKMGIDSEKITVVGEGTREIYRRNRDKAKSRHEVQQKFKIKNPYLLFVGTLEKRKNVKGLVEAFAKMQKATHHAVDLVLVGGSGFEFEAIERAINDSGQSQSIKRLGFVGEASLAELYAGSEAFVFPSLEEGFGIPVLEAMACGVPVITSNTTSLPEVAGGYATLVNPHDVETLAQAMSDVLKAGPAIMTKSVAGQIYARSKTWTRVAEETRQVYLRALGQSPPPP